MMSCTGLDFAARRPRFPRPGRVGIDNGESLARGDQRFELGDGAAVLDPLGVLFLPDGQSSLFEKPPGQAVVGGRSGLLDLRLEPSG